MADRRVVVKVGTSSLTDSSGTILPDVIANLVQQVHQLRNASVDVLVVTSAAIAAGVTALGMSQRPTDVGVLQAVSAVGQSRLMRVWDDAFATHGIVSGQVLLTPYDFVHRAQYLHARETLDKLLELGVVPVINENDAIANDEIRFGDNDRIAALVAHLVRAECLVLLTDIDGLFSGDPRTDKDATLIRHIDAVTDELEALAGGAGSERGSGGMASKVRAARIASISGVRVVIARAAIDDVVRKAVGGESVGTEVAPADRRLSSRKLWIGFAANVNGAVVVDDGAAAAVVARGSSLLPAGVVAVEGIFDIDDCIEVRTSAGQVVARGLARMASAGSGGWVGRRTEDLPVDHDVVIHRDDLVIIAN